jgi:hypothetical protein
VSLHFLPELFQGSPQGCSLKSKETKTDMNLRTKFIPIVTLILLAATALPSTAFGQFGRKKKNTQQEIHKLTPAQNALIDKSIVQEKLVIDALKKDTPLVETYIQNMKPDPVMSSTPEFDAHYLARVDFGRVIGDSQYAKNGQKTGGKFAFFRDSLKYITGLSQSLHLTYHDSGFIQMLLLDSNSYNRQTYQFSYVRAQFQGTIPVLLFDVQPVKRGNLGRFAGRIYVDKDTGNIVRFTGSFAGGQQDVAEYFHFDSYRTAVPPSKTADGTIIPASWLPYQVYVEQTDPKSQEHTLKFKALNYIWGYQLKVPTGDAEEADIEVGNGSDTAPTAQDMSPLAQQRMWVQQAEDNVIERLYVAGLIDAPSDFDKTLTQMANNILAYNKIPTDRPFRVRTLLTVPLESLAVGNTILISKGLIDTTAVFTADGSGDPQFGNLYTLLAFQVAHIILGHHIDTKFAFNDRMLFPSESVFQKIPMRHTDAEDAAAAKKAIELLAGSPELEKGEQYFDPQMGDSLIKPDGTFWLGALLGKGPKLNNTDTAQQAALPLDSFLKTDAWTDQTVQLNSPVDRLLGAADKMPFEVHPIFLQLSEYKPVTAAAAPPPAGATPAADNAPAQTAGTAPAAPAAAPAADGAAAPATTPPPPQP